VRAANSAPKNATFCSGGGAVVHWPGRRLEEPGLRRAGQPGLLAGQFQQAQQPCVLRAQPRNLGRHFRWHPAVGAVQDVSHPVNGNRIRQQLQSAKN
jgi:hypothetical protein